MNRTKFKIIGINPPIKFSKTKDVIHVPLEDSLKEYKSSLFDVYDNNDVPLGWFHVDKSSNEIHHLKLNWYWVHISKKLFSRKQCKFNRPGFLFTFIRNEFQKEIKRDGLTI